MLKRLNGILLIIFKSYHFEHVLCNLFCASINLKYINNISYLKINIGQTYIDIVGVTGSIPVAPTISSTVLSS